MPDTRPIIFGPGDKLRWLEDVAFDPEATDFEARLAIALSNRIDKYTGTASIDQVWLAEKVSGSERGARAALDRLADRKHLTIARSRGRGRANVYRPLGKRGTPVPLLPPEKGNDATQKEERRDTKRGTGVPPLPNDYPNSSLRAVADNTANDPLDPGQLRWLAVKGRLAKRVGSADMVSWFNHLALKRMTEHEAVLVARSEWACRHIENNYLGDRLREAWKAEMPSIERVLLITAADAAPMLRAAE